MGCGLGLLGWFVGERIGAEVSQVSQVCDTVHVDASPEEVWSWLAGLADHYRDWHPDHVSAEWVKGEPNEVGSVLQAVEYIGGHRETLRFVMTQVDAPHVMRYRIRGLHSILLPGGGFSVTAHGNGSAFTATIDYRFGGTLDRLLPRRTEALRAHVREEGVNLKHLVETNG